VAKNEKKTAIENSELRKLMGANIKREREKRKMTQNEFSEKIGLEEKTLSSVERGITGISMATLKLMCDKMQISAESILFGASQKNDVKGLTETLERLSPEQFRIVRDVVYKLMEAFALNKSGEE